MFYVPSAGEKLSHSIEDYPEGIVLPGDKPYGWTSADVIRRIKYCATRWFSKKNLKVGHAGTLDPLATGMLLVCIGAATREAERLQAGRKEYVAGVACGAVTPSYDLEKPVSERRPLEGVGPEQLARALEEFRGEQMQVAPLFSAKSVDGVRAYETARRLYREALRKGVPFDESEHELRSSKITLYELEDLGWRDGYEPQALSGAKGRIQVADATSEALRTCSLRVCCSKGTYIRALARDLGEALGSGAFLSSLRRTKVGELSVMLPLEQASYLFREAPHKVYFSLGSNMGSRRALLEEALNRMDEAFGAGRLRVSSVIETPAWGFEGAPFLNCVAEYELTLSPHEVLRRIKEIERTMGRSDIIEYDKDRTRIYHDRPIDIDILLFGDLRVSTPELTIPHPLMREREFVMRPLRELLPEDSV